MSVEASAELARLEEVKRGLEAKSGELAATIRHRNKAVYDVDAMAGARRGGRRRGPQKVRLPASKRTPGVGYHLSARLPATCHRNTGG